MMANCKTFRSPSSAPNEGPIIVQQKKKTIVLLLLLKVKLLLRRKVLPE